MMKGLLFGMLLVGSLNAFGEGQWKMVDHSENVRQSVKDGVSKAGLTCRTVTDSSTSEFSGDGLNYWFSIEGGLNVFVNTNVAEQPRLKFHREFQGRGTKENPHNDYTIFVTTDASRKNVVSLQYYFINWWVERTNVGTIEEPVYEETRLEQALNGDCVKR